ncbi:MAG: DNA polymerase/3'-5' exonuclease PolX, partial [Anaerolineales bacterium]|nr:DNA polymerase/3'-5' exonuclease PolX [Anaerolineales bacterium]
MPQYEELAAEVPESLIEIMNLEGMGPKRTAQLWHELDIRDLKELQAAAEKGDVAALDGFGEKTQQGILEEIERYKGMEQRTLLAEADQYVRSLTDYLQDAPGLERLEVAGSYRRRKETVGDIDILAIASEEPEKIMTYFTEYGPVAEVIAAGETRGTVRLESGLDVDLRILEPKSFGAALLYFTGSKAHNIHLRKLAVDQDLRISEYGIFAVDEEEEEGEDDPWAGEWLAGEKEEEIYDQIGLPWFPPELREDRGEIEEAQEGELPELITQEDIRGDLQMHSTWSDGKSSLEDMLKGCRERGYEYFAITDHGPSLAMTQGLDAGKARDQWEEINRLEEKYEGIRILRGMEVDILKDGTLDMDEETLEKLDLVVVSIHSHLDLAPPDQTERILRALEHPRVNILAHPTERKIQERSPMVFDMEAVLEAAAEHGVAVELNAQPNRLDLSDVQVRLAKEKGAVVVINTDAHRVEELAYMRYGVDQARRGWLEPGDVLNTLSIQDLIEGWLG